MGASPSTSQSSSSKAEQEEESLAAATTSLPILRAAFSNLSKSTPPCSSLPQAFSLETHKTITPESQSQIPAHFSDLLLQIGPSISDLFFHSTGDGGGISWFNFLRGYNRCCAPAPVSSALAAILRLYCDASSKAGVPPKLAFDSDDLNEGKVEGSLAVSDVLMVLWVCWIMGRACKISRLGVVALPDVSHLVLSAFAACGEVGDDEGVWSFDVFQSEKSVAAQKFCLWALSTVPGLSHCLSRFVQKRVRTCAAMEGEIDFSSLSIAGDASSKDNPDTYLLTCGRAWAISLTQRNTLGEEELLGACFPRGGKETRDNLLYRSSLHGKGLSRFWSCVEGYNGPLLILLSANSVDVHEGKHSAQRWIIGVSTAHGFEDRETFYGTTGNLYSISPIFRAFSPSGKDKNFIYCHLHPAVRVYEPHPKPVGLAFGGTIGNERIFIDDDFAKITIHHHAADKTYQPGPLVPNQGYLPVEASVVEVEVWGLGGQAAKELQNAYKDREALFSEQRRKIDLKTFVSWDDSPEKMMMDMISDPNRVQREDR